MVFISGSIPYRTTVQIIIMRYPNPYISSATFIVGECIKVRLIKQNSSLKIVLFTLSFMSLASS